MCIMSLSVTNAQCWSNSDERTIERGEGREGGRGSEERKKGGWREGEGRGGGGKG